MPLEYINRKGDVYYLYAGQTPKGRRKYYCAPQLGREPLDSVPEGYEIWESPEGGLVYVRKIRPVTIRPLERALVEAGIRRLNRIEHFLIDVQGDSLVVYLPALDERESAALARVRGPGEGRAQAIWEERIRRAPYEKLMRFVLADSEKRLFCAQRWCFRGSIDDWISLSGPTPLMKLVDRFVKHLGEESFFELV